MPDIDEKTRDQSSPVWDMSQERAFIETLTNQRFNFFLLVFAFVIAGAINSKAQLFLRVILFLGAIICTLLAIAIYRINRKLGKILENLKLDKTHPVTIIDNEIGGFSVRWITGQAIPIGCSVLLWIFSIISLFTNQIVSTPK